MKVLSPTYPGITLICENCYCLLAIDPHKDIYENKYIYCPLCNAKNEVGIHEVEWRPAVENKIEGNISNEST